MTHYLKTEDELRDLLRRALVGDTQAKLAERIGIGSNLLSMMLNGAPITGKAVAYLGYKKVRTKFFEKV
jgi:hypothetical protein